MPAIFFASRMAGGQGEGYRLELIQRNRVGSIGGKKRGMVRERSAWARQRGLAGAGAGLLPGRAYPLSL